MENIILKVPGISCSHCENAIKGALKEFKGIENLIVDVKNKKVTFDYDKSKVNLEQVKNAIEDQGYDIEN